jgi:hypothetical protein
MPLGPIDAGFALRRPAGYALTRTRPSAYKACHFAASRGIWRFEALWASRSPFKGNRNG